MTGGRRYGVVFGAVLVATSVTVAGCTTLLGDFSDGTAPVDASIDTSTMDAGVADASPMADTIVRDVTADVVCVPPQFACNGVCVAHDSTNCATCGDTCATGAMCTMAEPGYACDCPSLQLACPTDAGAATTVCTSVQADTHNCGRCGHDCLEGTCSAGTCTEVTLVTSPGTGAVNDITTDGVNVYWTVSNPPDAGGGAYQVSVHGAPAGYAQLGASEYSDDIAVSGTQVFWTVGGSTNYVYEATVGVANSAVSPPYLVPGGSGEYVGEGLALDPSGHELYFMRGNAASTTEDFVGCQTVPLTCTTFPVPASLYDTLMPGVATDGTSVYWNTRDAINVAGAASAGVGTNMRTFATFVDGTTSPYWLSASAGALTWSSISGSGILRSPTSAYAPTMVVTDAAPSGIVSDANFVYWTDYVNNAVSWVPVGGGGISTAPANEPGQLTKDSTSLYWVNAGDNTIRKIALP
jgi:hypothetical protein